MKFLVISLIVTGIVGCKNAEKNLGPAAEVPEAMSCPGSLDPNQACPDAVKPVGPIRPDPLVRVDKPAAEPASDTITGTCEMKIKGESSTRTCEELRLTVTSIRNNDVHHAQISGFDVKFAGLNEKSYRFVASSDKYSVKAKTGELRPGQSVKIQVFASPRTQR